MKRFAWNHLLFLLLIFSFASQAWAQEREITLTLGAYATPREAYRRIIPLFQKAWQEKTGQRLQFKESYVGSGAQSRAIAGGLEADVAALALDLDIDRLAGEGLITHDWRAKPFNGIVTTSLVVIVFREGNPLGIRDWADLVGGKEVEVLAPDPKASGGAMWNVMAAYGAAKRGRVGGYPEGEEGAKRFLADLFRRVFVLDKSARDSIINYERGVGDILLTYENEAWVGKLAGKTYGYVIPSSTIRIENPVAVVDRYAEKHGVRPVAEAFVDFLWTKEAQQVFAELGYRSVQPEVAEAFRSRFPEPREVWDIGYFSGWQKAAPDFFGPQGVFTKLMEEIHRER
jgi:sulfate transport system substrate-binding protein